MSYKVKQCETIVVDGIIYRGGQEAPCDDPHKKEKPKKKNLKTITASTEEE